MRIVYIVYYMTYGGIERQITQLANEMAERGHEVSIISMVKNASCFAISNKVNHIHIDEKGTGKIAIINRYRNLKRKLKKLEPDITVNFMFQSAYFCAFMPKSITGYILYSERGFPQANIYSIPLKIIRAITLPRIDKFVFQTNGAKEYFGKCVQKKSKVIPNPVFIKIEDFNKKQKYSHTIINVGRLCEQKNQKLLIEAFNKVNKIHPEYSLEIYGEGKLEKELTLLIENLGLQDKVKLMGTTGKIYEKMLNSEMFVLTSDFEGIPNVLIEAMALGIPSISTDCEPGGARELINHGEDGLIVPCNDKAQLVAAICKLIEEPDFAKKLGRNAAVNIQRYSSERIYDMWEEFITLDM